MLNVSIVLYRPNWQQISELTNCLLLSKHINHIYWIDNSPIANIPPSLGTRITYHHNPKNIGYGAAHNIAIRESIYDNIPYHLVINPDIILTPDALDQMLYFINSHPEIGSLMPKVIYPNGELQFLCKLLPTHLTCSEEDSYHSNG